MGSTGTDEQSKSGPIKSGFHPFINFPYSDVVVEYSSDHSSRDPKTYNFQDQSEFYYFRVSAGDVLNGRIPDGNLLLSISYTLNSTRDYSRVFNCRQIFQVEDNVFVFFERGSRKPHGVELDHLIEERSSLEGIIIVGQLSMIIEIFLRWLVEVDPIGFELLRRVGRDGVPPEGVLTIHEDLSAFHDSDSLMDRWRNRIADYADSIDLSVAIDIEKTWRFSNSLTSEIRSMTSYTGSDLFQRFERQEWIHPEDRDDLD